jgi:hypothetical protein
MKFYDSHIYKQEKKFEAIVLIICIFVIGFIAGYACIDYAINNNVENVIESEEKNENICNL